MAIADSQGTTAGRSATRSVAETAVFWSGRVAGAGLVVWMGWIHLHLWSEGYEHIKTVGPLFMANFVASIAVALVLLAVPTRRLLSATAAAGGALAAGTLAGLALSINAGLFGFTESWNAPFAHLSFWVEVAASVVLFATAAGAYARRNH
jgi:hypothetical protein